MFYVQWNKQKTILFMFEYDYLNHPVSRILTMHNEDY